MPSAIPAPDLVASIKIKLQQAERSGRKTAMFHFQVLKHADQLESVNAELFCQAVNVPASFKTEFSKMVSVARLMRQEGYRLSEA